MTSLPQIRPPTLVQSFVPASRLRSWVTANILTPGGAIYNPDFADLQGLSIGFLWSGVKLEKGGARVLGTCELAESGIGRLSDAWTKGKRKQQLSEWFEEPIDFLITLYAPFAEDANVASLLSVIEHELYHCGIKDWVKAKPILMIRRHDIEVFIGEVRRYGAAASMQPIAELVEAASRQPTIGMATLDGICGSCVR